jgi:hypothetical protein
MMMRLRLRMHDPSRRSPSADNAPEEHRSAIARDAVVVPGHVAVNPAPHRSPLFDRSHDGRREARKMPSARAVDLRENVGRIAPTQFRLESQLLDRNTVLARSLTLVKSAFTSESSVLAAARRRRDRQLAADGWRLENWRRERISKSYPLKISMLISEYRVARSFPCAVFIQQSGFSIQEFHLQLRRSTVSRNQLRP